MFSVWRIRNHRTVRRPHTFTEPMSLTIPNYSAVPLRYEQSTPPKGSALDDLERQHFGGSLSAWVYLNDVTFRYLDTDYALTDHPLCQISDDEWAMECAIEGQHGTSDTPCVSLFSIADGINWSGIELPLPDHLIEHLNYQFTRLCKPPACDLLYALGLHMLGGRYQNEDDSDRDPWADAPGWIRHMVDVLPESDGIWNLARDYVERHPELLYTDTPALHITEAVDRAVAAERILLDDFDLNITDGYLAPENGLFDFQCRKITATFDSDLINAAWEAQGEMCGNDMGNLVHPCTTETQLRKALSYLRAIDNLYKTLWHIHESAQSEELKPSRKS